MFATAVVAVKVKVMGGGCGLVWKEGGMSLHVTCKFGRDWSRIDRRAVNLVSFGKRQVPESELVHGRTLQIEVDWSAAGL